MKIGIIEGADKSVYVNMLLDAKTKEEFKLCLEKGESAIAFLDTDSLKFPGDSSVEDLEEAFELIHRLVSLNHFCEGSVCHALEKLLTAVFWEGIKAK